MQEAVAVLLAACSELEPVWVETASIFGPDPNEVGIYGLFGHIVLPVLQALLTGQPSAELDPFLPSGAVERAAFTTRLYVVLDRWALSEDATIRHAVYLELTEGYGGLHGDPALTGDDLLAQAGPSLKRLVEKQSQMPWGLFYDFLRDQ